MKKLFTFAFLFWLQIPHIVRAQVNPLDSLQQVGTEVYGSGAPADIKITIAKIVRAILGFVGIVFVVLIIIGGIQWMTSGGNEKKIEEAKKRIVNATIGLVIILAAYSIALSITKWLQGATSGKPGNQVNVGG
ncbi:MAG: hypothetical protein HY422_02565 [Candidatus Komeilibacteria bacterium]|nr:hypothetical protein [Candidatus Komeilibacteria bacterium]